MTRLHMAGIAFVLLLGAVVALNLVGGESAADVAARLEGAMGMALAALLGEAAYKARGAVVGALLLLGLLCVGCGASSETVRATACDATRLACTACEAAQERYCGGAVVETEDGKTCEPPIDREYPGGEVIEQPVAGET
ncbi:MAG TPA: hypothetical protein VEB22_00590 [Phycisphaerales bacterium]|nr:hypothetical protein [Phycisphaerales bacterium]